MVRGKTSEGWDDLGYTVRVVKLSDLFVDPAYQNNLSKKIAELIKAKFNPKAIGQIVVSQRTDGTLALVDGFARTDALSEKGYSEWEARVYEGLSRKEEAQLYVDLQNRKKDKTDSVYKARYTAGDKKVLSMVDIITRAGFGMKTACLPPEVHKRLASRKTKLPVLECPKNLEKVYDMGETVFQQTITTLKLSLEEVDSKRKAEGKDHNVLLAIGLLFSKYGRKIDAKHLVQKLRRKGFLDIIIAGNDARKNRVTRENAVLAAIEKLYNNNLRNTKKL